MKGGGNQASLNCSNNREILVLYIVQLNMESLFLSGSHEIIKLLIRYV